MEGAPQRAWLKRGWAERAGQPQGPLAGDHISGLSTATSCLHLAGFRGLLDLLPLRGAMVPLECHRMGGVKLRGCNV